MGNIEENLLEAIAQKDENAARALVTGELEPETAERVANAAMEAGMIELFQTLVQRALPLVDQFGETWLMKAAFMGNLLFVQFLHGVVGMPISRAGQAPPPSFGPA
jgi:hypothetical protein